MSFAPEPSQRSWLESANDPQCGFPLENLPFCVFESENGAAHIGIGIGDQVLDLHACAEAGLLTSDEPVGQACLMPTLNGLMSCGTTAYHALRADLLHFLGEQAPVTMIDKLKPHLRPMRDTKFRLAVQVPNYTDFYASIHHATNVGRLFRPDQPLLPNYKWVPIGYHGRASSIVVSDTGVQRPHGQIKAAQASAPMYAPTQQLDFELELGVYIGGGNPLGFSIPVSKAHEHLWGVSLLNDWSARDIQAWEYQPLGPFLGKSFATTVSPWVVTAAALQPFRTAMASRPPEDPAPLPYLQSPNPATDAFDITLEVHLSTARMREDHLAPVLLSRSNPRELYWSFRQMIAHHTCNGCNLQPGDLVASGTISGPEPGSLGSLLEITERGAHPITLPSGETRSFLHDGDEITLTGYCQGEDLPLISLGECRGRIAAAQS